MNRYLKAAFALLSILFILSPATTAAAAVLGISPLTAMLVAIAVTFTLAFVGKRYVSGVAAAGITKEIWTQDIIDNLFKDNEFAKRAFDADMYVLAGKVVHIPAAGSPSEVKKNLSTFPQAGVKRADTDVTYAIDTYYTVPRHVEKIEQYELSYDKRQSCLGEDQQALIEAAMDGLLYRWAPAQVNCFRTDGGTTAKTTTPSYEDGTGTRYTFDKSVFGKIKLKMDKMNIPKQGRVALLTADHYDQFYESLSDGEKTGYNNVANLAEGVVGRYKGFDIMMRSSVLRYRPGANSTITVVDEQDEAFVSNGADCAASLFYHDKSVERAMGQVEMFDNTNRADYYGDIFSFILRMGGRTRRAAGVYGVVEGTAS